MPNAKRKNRRFTGRKLRFLHNADGAPRQTPWRFLEVAAQEQEVNKA